MQKTIQLLVQTDYSLLNSLIKIDSLIAFLKANKIKACAVVDDNLANVMEYYNKCLKNHLKFLIGLKITYEDHILYLYPKDYIGYKNLLKIHTNKENIKKEILIKYSNNIICVLKKNSQELFNELSFFDDLYLGYETEYEKTECLIKTNNIVYLKEIRCLKKEDNKYFEYLNLLGGENNIDYDYSYPPVSEEDAKLIEKFIDKINIKFNEDKRYIPKYKENIDSYKFLKTLANAGLKKRLGSVDEVYQKRLDYELDVINNMNFVDYFLIVYDYCLYAKKHNCLVGPGRGSAAGSLVCYSIGITDIDPIKYDLMFERFLNPNRVTMPDIDIDFESSKRDLIIDYVKEKYGSNNVASGLTFNTLKTKLVLREVFRLLKINNDLLNKFIKVINGNISLKDNLKNESVKKFINFYPEIKQAYKISLKLEGLKKNISTHAAGVVISSIELDEVIPTLKEQDRLLTGITMEYLENLGLLKMDFLGLKNLTIIANILEKIGNDKLKDIDLNDKLVLDIFKKGNTNGIFQFETYAMKNLLLKLKPDSFSDLIASVALVRPGPSAYLQDYINVKEKKQEPKYLHPLLKDILESTNGIILYQEQIISILERIGQFTKAEADIIRRAISKKDESIMLKSKDKFIEGAKELGVDKTTSEKIYAMIVKFSSYGFNKSHSVAYTVIAYQMAYLKVYYPINFINELLQNNKNSKEINEYLTELKNLNYKIIKPDINYSKEDFYINDEKIILPLTMIKGITKPIAASIEKEMPFKDYPEFTSKCFSFINEKILNSLIEGNALRSLKLNQKTLKDNMESVLNYASLQTDDESLKPLIESSPDYDLKTIRDFELNSYGFFINEHPSSKYHDKSITKINEIDTKLFKNINMIVLVERINRIKTKNNKDMAFISVSDETGKTDLVIFENNLKMIDNIDKNDLVFITGQVSKSFDKTRIIINNISKR